MTLIIPSRAGPMSLTISRPVPLAGGPMMLTMGWSHDPDHFTGQLVPCD
jgi:hypothetical protein